MCTAVSFISDPITGQRLGGVWAIAGTVERMDHLRGDKNRCIREGEVQLESTGRMERLCQAVVLSHWNQVEESLGFAAASNRGAGNHCGSHQPDGGGYGDTSRLTRTRC